MRSLRAAIAFLTRFPLGRKIAFDTADVARSSAWFPLIGLALGALYWLSGILLKDHLPPLVVGILLVALDAVATGALHFDGLADTADGFGGGKTRDDVLRIMRDHAIGSYGGLALAAVIALKGAAYAALLPHFEWTKAAVLTPALGRWSMLLLAATLPYARPGDSVIRAIDRRSMIIGTLLMAMTLAASRSPRAWIAAAGVLAVTIAFGYYCRHRIAGITGDTLGANLELSESAALLTFLWTAHS